MYCTLFWIPVIIFMTIIKVSLGQIGTSCTTDPSVCDGLLNGECSDTLGICFCATDFIVDTGGCSYNCGTLTTPNGVVDTPGGVITGDTATYTCETGYKLNGVSNRLCVENVGWDGTESTCDQAILGDDCSVFTDMCTNLVFAECGTGDVCACIINYADDSTGICVRDCLTQPAALPYGVVTGTAYLEGNTVTYSCDTGYVMEGATTATCQADGTWDNTATICRQRGDCYNAPPTPTNGQVASTTFLEGDTITYSCDTGYVLVGSATATCQIVGTWDNLVTTCIGAVLGDDCSVFTDMCTNLVFAECGTGDVCACIINYADDSTGICVRDCLTQPPAPTNGAVTGSAYLKGNTVTYSCDTGYVMEGVTTATCQADGTWNNTATTCRQRANCHNAPPTPTNGNVASTTFLEGDIITYSCDTGYLLVGSATATCKDDGTWDNLVTTCIRDEGNTCPSDVDNLGTIWEQIPIGYTATKQCPLGYEGNVTRECNLDAKWLLSRSNCVGESVKEIQQQITELTNESSSEVVGTVLQNMANVTQELIESTATVTLTDMELNVVVSSLNVVADLLHGGEVTDAISNSFLDTASNILDESNKNTWNTLGQHDVSAGVVLVSAVGTLSQLLTTQLATSSKNKTVIVKDNIVVEIKKTEGIDIVVPSVSSSDVPDNEWSNDMISNIRVPADALPAGSVISAGILFKNMSEVMPVNKNESSKEQDTKILNGPVLALTLTPTVTTISPKLTIVFEHTLTGYSYPECSFWNFQSNARGFWSSEGCSLVETNSIQTTCECDHLTNFAVLMSPFKKVETDSIAIRIVSIVGMVCSILCLIITIVTHIYLWRYLRSVRVTILMHLCISMIISYIVFLLGVDRTESKLLCTIVSALLHYIYLVVFCIMLVEGIVVTIAVLFVFVKNYRLKLLLTLAWFIPAVITGISLGITKTEGYGNTQFCWLSTQTGLIWAFVGPALLVIVINIVLLVIIIRAMLQSRAMSQKGMKDKIKTSVWSLCVLVPLMGVTWILGILYVNDDLYWMQYLFAVCNGLQGVFICFIHCLFNIQVKTAYATHGRRKSATSLKSNKVSNREDSVGSSTQETTFETDSEQQFSNF